MAIKKPGYFVSDEELGKRDDDHRPSKMDGWLPRSNSHPLPVIRKRRILGLIAFVIFAYLFVHNVPNLGPAKYRFSNFGPPDPPAQDGLRRAQRLTAEQPAARANPARTLLEKAVARPAERVAQDYEGPVKFYTLGSTLRAIGTTNGHLKKNKNVLFAASDLKAAADLIPLACQMTQWKRNYVHMVLMGRDHVPIEEIQRVNGVDKNVCDIYWHDARPDHRDESTELRMEISVAGALGHCEEFMHPQAVITGTGEHKDHFFTKAMRRKTKDLHQTLIELPRNKLQSLSWVTRLEASALNAWHSATLDILVQAPKDSSAPLIRLLKSLKSADYSGFTPPRLILELPHKLNQDVLSYIDGFTWPPSQYQTQPPKNEIILRRRIPERRALAREASTRFVESFYPSNPSNSHVLVLSPRAELSPVYYYYLKYNLLEYKYSSTTTPNVFGISLESPSVHLNGSTAFEPPSSPSRHTSTDGQDLQPYLWQAPNSNAALYFGEKWVEFHSFLSKLQTAFSHPTTKEHLRKRRKVVSERTPSWAEHLLDLMRARGQYMLYPGLNGGPSRLEPHDKPFDSLAIVHNELYQAPEEFVRRKSQTDENPATGPPASSSVLEAPAEYLSTHNKPSEEDILNNEIPLLRSLDNILLAAPPPHKKGNEPTERAGPYKDSKSQVSKPDASLPLESLPLLDYRGDQITPDDLAERAEHVAIGFRKNAGGCSDSRSQENGEVISGNADDLFCLDDSDIVNDSDLDDDEVEDGALKESTDSSSRSSSSVEHVRDGKTKQSKQSQEDDGEYDAFKSTKSTPDQKLKYKGPGKAPAVADAQYTDLPSFPDIDDPARNTFKPRKGKDSGKDVDDKNPQGKGYRPPDDLTDVQAAELEDWKRKKAKDDGELSDAEGTGDIAKLDRQGRRKDGGATAGKDLPRAKPDEREDAEEDEELSATAKSKKKQQGKQTRIAGSDAGGIDETEKDEMRPPKYQKPPDGVGINKPFKDPDSISSTTEGDEKRIAGASRNRKPGRIKGGNAGGINEDENENEDNEKEPPGGGRGKNSKDKKKSSASEEGEEEEEAQKKKKKSEHQERRQRARMETTDMHRGTEHNDDPVAEWTDKRLLRGGKKAEGKGGGSGSGRI
ncbi:MAG: hypothetical protein M1831_002732 [Alyxoria varia]|nr:MAG: hypothetical protein M1831_002732 [Alyxoria varia]